MSCIKNNKGFGVTGAVIAGLIIVVLFLTAYTVWDKSKDNPKDTSISKTDKSITKSTNTETTKDPNEGYFLVKEWGLRFKVPSGIFDVKYKINGDTLAFYAKPAGLKYDYVKDYDQIDNTGNFSLASGVIYRSKDSINNSRGDDVEGKKVGDYYYYTAWSFSGLATGAACSALYDMQNEEEQCQENNKAFNIVNRELIKSIELIQ